MASSSSSSWVKGFSGSPTGEACSGTERSSTPLADLLAEIGDERLPYPLDDPAAPVMSRREIAGRVLWTRAVVDGDMTAIKVLLEYLGGKAGDGDGDGGVRLNADLLSAAERELQAWRAAIGTTEESKEEESGEMEERRDGNVAA